MVLKRCSVRSVSLQTLTFGEHFLFLRSTIETNDTRGSHFQPSSRTVKRLRKSLSSEFLTQIFNIAVRANREVPTDKPPGAKSPKAGSSKRCRFLVASGLRMPELQSVLLVYRTGPKRMVRSQYGHPSCDVSRQGDTLMKRLKVPPRLFGC